jgi:rhodanese-related sulfurtransferase
MYLFKAIAFTFIFISLAAGVAAGADERSASGNVRSSEGPHCGIFTLYAAMRLHNRTVSIDSLMKPEFVSSAAGSTLFDLQRAADQHRFFSMAMQRMTIADLRQSPVPVILHTQSREGTGVYDHYILFVQADEAGALVLDAPNPLRHVPFTELSRVWGGVGLAVSSEPIAEGRLLAAGRVQLLIYTVIVITGIAIAQAFAAPLGRRTQVWPALLQWSAQAGCLVGLAVGMGVAYHCWAAAGFLAVPRATAAVDQAHIVSPLQYASVVEVHAAVKRGAVLVDARLASDFHSEHLNGSINIHAAMDSKAREAALKDFSHATPLIVFCKSANCGYSTAVAKTLLRDGYTDVRIFRGGWNDWAAVHDNSSMLVPAPAK